jgi:hypothetical protein
MHGAKGFLFEQNFKSQPAPTADFLARAIGRRECFDLFGSRLKVSRI